ncbi:MAG TPA: HAD-IIA family hydrolase [Candidatus Hydrogenedentes bacterium]|nr:HAD-IIA family hydrolase [Candidatus Hydrogenedentota bacterium]HNT86696.1 HAD-IIA family hydrolase [Candidatus Hydrogenedentota bacterium]
MDLDRLRRLRYFLLDMDGTVYLGPRPIPGAPEFIRHLRDSGRRRLFFTNNPTRDAAAYSEKLGRMGIEATPEDILTAGEATVRYLRTQTPYRKLYTVAPESFAAELEAAGFVLDDASPEAVVISFDTSLTYAKLERACLLLRQGLPYVATNPDKVCPTEYGFIPDCGAIAALIEAATGRTPKFIGKPDPEMARMGMAKIGAAPETTAMVGDRLYTDMRMARAAGIASVLVLSGETTAADLEAAEDAPDFVFPSVRELHRALCA